MTTDQTLRAISNQFAAMGCPLEVCIMRTIRRGQLNEKRVPKLHLCADLAAVLALLPALKRANPQGADIYIRPPHKAASDLVLVDDLNRAAVERMRADGLAPAITVETSPANFQAWIKLDRPVSPVMRKLVARALAATYDGDLGAADGVHYGRLAGFTNQKPKRRLSDGHAPFCKLATHSGIVAAQAAALLHQANEHVAASHAKHVAAGAVAAATPVPVGQGRADDIERLSAWFARTWVTTARAFEALGTLDQNRVDWTLTLQMLSGGASHATAERVLLNASTSKRKGEATDPQRIDYAERTTAKASVVITLLGGASIWSEEYKKIMLEHGHELLELARSNAHTEVEPELDTAPAPLLVG